MNNKTDLGIYEIIALKPKRKTNLLRPLSNLGRYFSWDEMLNSSTAVKHGIDNIPNEDEIRVIREFVKRLLDPLRIAYDNPIRITSGYRCRELNRLVGGVTESQHMKGEAADCMIDDYASVLLGVLLMSQLPFDQAILYEQKNFLHLSLRPDNKNRRQVIIK